MIKTVLIVEDNELNMKLFNDLLETRGCRIVQLTTHKSRDRAHAFYEGLGFERSHIGMKLHLGASGV